MIGRLVGGDDDGGDCRQTVEMVVVYGWLVEMVGGGRQLG